MAGALAGAAGAGVPRRRRPGAPAAEARRVEPVVQQPVHGYGADAGGSPRGVQGRALRLPAVVAHARGWWGGARAPAQAASLEVILRASLFPRILLAASDSAAAEPAFGGWRAGRSSPPPSGVPTSSTPCPSSAGPRRPPGACPLPARNQGSPRTPAGAPRARLPRCPSRATSNEVSSPPRPVPATEHAQSCPPPPSFNMGTEVLRLRKEEMGGLGFVWRSQPRRDWARPA